MGTSAIRLVVTLVALFQLAGAVNIIAYPNRGGCRGRGIAFNNIPPGRCTSFRTSAGSVLFVNVRACEDSNVYRGGPCLPRHRVESRRGSTCFTNGGYSAADFLRSRCGTPSLNDDVDTSQCSQVQAQNATAVVYTEDADEGHWMLAIPDATKVFVEMESLPECEKIAWLQARGAAFVANTDGEIEIE